MNKKENRIAVRQAAEKAVIRDEQNRRIQVAATNPIKEVLKNLHTTFRGLDPGGVTARRQTPPLFYRRISHAVSASRAGASDRARSSGLKRGVWSFPPPLPPTPQRKKSEGHTWV